MTSKSEKVKVRISLSAAVRDALADEKARTGAELSEMVNNRLAASYVDDFIRGGARRPTLHLNDRKSRGN